MARIKQTARVSCRSQGCDGYLNGVKGTWACDKCGKIRNDFGESIAIANKNGPKKTKVSLDQKVDVTGVGCFEDNYMCHYCGVESPSAAKILHCTDCNEIDECLLGCEYCKEHPRDDRRSALLAWRHEEDGVENHVIFCTQCFAEIETDIWDTNHLEHLDYCILYKRYSKSTFEEFRSSIYQNKKISNDDAEITEVNKRKVEEIIDHKKLHKEKKQKRIKLEEKINKPSPKIFFADQMWHCDDCGAESDEKDELEHENECFFI
jgi:hypothetical protein